MKPAVTVVISTYGRVGHLHTTLASIYRQSFCNWKVLLVADCCDKAFFDALGPLDERVEVINLPVNCGHQYGPNSIGIRLATSDYIAFMNHDDLWTSDHLELAITRLEQSNKDAYFGQAAFCHSRNQPGWPEGSEPLRFSEYNRPQFYWRSLFGPFYFFEPASAWVVRTSVAKSIGDWLPPNKTDITPVMDWFARFFCLTSKVVFGDVTSTLKINLRNTSVECEHLPLYFRGTIGSDKLRELISIEPLRLRDLIAIQVNQAEKYGLIIRQEMIGNLVIDAQERERIRSFERFRKIGCYQRELIGETIGPYTAERAFLTHTKRTGNEYPQFPAVEQVFDLYLKM